MTPFDRAQRILRHTKTRVSLHGPETPLRDRAVAHAARLLAGTLTVTLSTGAVEAAGERDALRATFSLLQVAYLLQEAGEHLPPGPTLRIDDPGVRLFMAKTGPGSSNQLLLVKEVRETERLSDPLGRTLLVLPGMLLVQPQGGVIQPMSRAQLGARFPGLREVSAADLDLEPQISNTP